MPSAGTPSPPRTGTPLSGWGRYPRLDCAVARPRSDQEVRALMAAGPLIARGNGRAYGDSAMNPGATLDMTGFDRMLAFDPSTGLLVVEAGVLLADVIAALLPQGWFPPVTPGTRFVTIGGMIAADVHGKNHHKHGSFGRFVEWIDLFGTDGAVLRCSQDENAELFGLTLGGMGLTGVILRAAFRLTPVETGWIRQESTAAPCLEACMDLFERTGDWTYSVAWIDCASSGAQLGRSILMLGEHARRSELGPREAAEPYRMGGGRRLGVPVDAPSFLLNRLSIRAFNSLYYARGRQGAGTSLVNWDTFFYPLDAILNWNRLYGRRGFAQFQCVLPLEASKSGMTRLLGAISEGGGGSFLAVLKRMGVQESRFSFPMEGYTLALDFPINDANLALLTTLDAITIDHGGRFYLAKDARMTAETLRRSDPRAAAFRDRRDAAGMSGRLASAQSGRLAI